MSDLEKLLQDIWEKVCKEAEEKREKKKRKGEYYNVFNALGIQGNELRHSAFIADLLNPKGNHGAGDEFLKAFLRLVPPKGCLREDYLNVDSLSFRLETEHKTEDGRIDIIADDGRHALIIENKIHARDQKSQLARYSNYHRDHKLIYLTLDGHEPSNASTGGDKDLEYTCMSYEKHIIPWLTECVSIASKRPLVRETIKQYIYLIKELIHITMEDKELKKVTKIAIKNGNIAATVAILQAQHKIRETLITQYIFKLLKEEFEPKKFKVEISKDNGHTCIRFSKDGWHKKSHIFIASDKTTWGKMFVNVKRRGEDEPRTRRKLSCLTHPPKCGYPYGWEWVYGDETKSDWESPDSYVDIKNGEIAKWLIKKINDILKELEKNKIEL